MILLFIIIGNDIGVEGAKAIFEALKTNTTLTKIDLERDNNNAVIFILSFHSLYKQ